MFSSTHYHRKCSDSLIWWLRSQINKKNNSSYFGCRRLKWSNLNADYWLWILILAGLRCVLMWGAYDQGFSSGKRNAESVNATPEYQYVLLKWMFYPQVCRLSNMPIPKCNFRCRERKKEEKNPTSFCENIFCYRKSIITTFIDLFTHHSEDPLGLVFPTSHGRKK